MLTDQRFRANLAGGQMTLPDALEQILWDEPPFTTILGRWATGPTELGGQQIAEGDMLLLGLAAGNVDPTVRPDLDAPVLGNRSHLAFGGGPHECPGQDMARAIADTGIDTLLARLPDLLLGCDESELEWSSSLMSRHLSELPVEFTPSPAKGRSDTRPAFVVQGRTRVPAADAAAEPAPSTAASATAEAPARPIGPVRRFLARLLRL
jgi:cytochrome P450